MGEDQEGDISPWQYSDCLYKCSPCDWQYVFELNARRADQLYCITACDASTSSKPLQLAEQEVLNDICSLQMRQSQAQFLLNCSPRGCCLLTQLGEGRAGWRGVLQEDTTIGRLCCWVQQWGCWPLPALLFFRKPRTTCQE